MKSLSEYIFGCRYSQFFKLADQCISESLKRELPPHAEEYLSLPEFLREFRTTKLSVGRRVGKTTYIKARSLMCRHLIFVPNQNMAKEFDLTDSTLRNRWNVVTPKNIKENNLHLDKVDFVFVDEPSFVFEHIDINVFYNCIARLKPEQIIMLGE